MKFFIALVIASILIGGLITQDFIAQLISPQINKIEQAQVPEDQFNSHCLGTEPPEKYPLSGLIVTLGQSNFPIVSVISTPKPHVTETTKVPATNASTNNEGFRAKPNQVANNSGPKNQPSTTSVAIQQIANTAAKPVPKPNPVVKPTTNPSPNSWILQQPTKHFTLQIVSGRNQAALQELADKYLEKLPYAIYKRQLEGKNWYSLIVGSYPSPRAANRAKKTLPKGLKGDKAWPKKFAEIHQQLQ